MKFSLALLINKIRTPAVAPYLILGVSTGSLLFAFIMQYGFDLHPCILCLWQRVPFGVAIIGSLIAALLHPTRIRSRLGLTLSALSFLTNLILSIFHTGVERQWWLGTQGCSIHPLEGQSVADLRTQLLHTVTARCDEIAWTFLGLSMANWNVVLSFLLSVYCLFILRLSFKAPNL